jgi:hypothetical protein
LEKKTNLQPNEEDYLEAPGKQQQAKKYIMKDLTQQNPDGFEVRNYFALLNSTMNASAYLPAFDDTFIESVHTENTDSTHTHTVQTVDEKHHQNKQKTDVTSHTMTTNTEKNTKTPEVIGQGDLFLDHPNGLENCDIHEQGHWSVHSTD